MTTNKNRLRLDYKDMPDLKAALGGVEPGQRCTLDLKLMIVTNSDDFLEGDIESVDYDLPGEEDGEGDDAKPKSGTAEPTADEPVMVEVMRRNAGKAKDTSAADDESPDEAAAADEAEGKK